MKRTALGLVMLITVSVAAQTVDVAPATNAARIVRSLADTSDLHNVYAPIGSRLLWTRNGKPTAQAQALLSLFVTAETKGLRSADYAVAAPAAGDDASLARFDVAMTAATLRYVAHLHSGRIDPHSVGFDFDVAAKQLYLPAVVMTLAESNDVASAIAALEPQQPEYRRLLTALATYRRIASEPEIVVPAVAKLSPSDHYDALPQLAAKLRRLGDLTADAKVDGTLYDGAIVDAMKHFQKRHGLEADGVVSRRTFAALNTPAAARVQQLEWALERARWMPSTSDAAVLVNIPEFTLHAVDRNGELAMRVVVGQAAGHKTPVFDGDIQHVVFRPSWSVPTRIQRNEIVPKVVRDRDYLARNRYEIVDGTGRAIGSSVDDATLAALRTGAFRVRQKSGDANALGLFKFVFPNDNDVYLHSTPAQALFARTRRDFSHGCIRVEDPVALAAWALQWSPEKVRAALASKREDLYVRLDKTIPVVILYNTAVATADGDVHFYDDIYGHDATLAAALAPAHTQPATMLAAARR
ncbi:MAG: L,D-transpeptidase family protein [Acidobacteria bacterium]|nr:L,D-transpeptidase family protein [Acidobacteriota bacterium]MBV9474993.1 L,D-transpeptidase family protein [Acidobacteriota bacterium]